ncbi:DUF2158 domain-containing protein [Ralstonia sp. ASV6]|uniref:YodC family protein n=1 Tax=Ralstonia sp. ASV6 TaxID=2795124 RepID=UPI0018ED6412
MSFQPGDVVQLKSGGPRMTVEKVGNDAMTGVEAVWCTWFEKVGSRQTVQRDTFPPATLDKAGAPGLGAIGIHRG